MHKKNKIFCDPWETTLASWEWSSPVKNVCAWQLKADFIITKAGFITQARKEIFKAKYMQNAIKLNVKI